VNPWLKEMGHGFTQMHTDSKRKRPERGTVFISRVSPQGFTPQSVCICVHLWLKRFLFPQTCFAPEQIDPIQHIGRQPDHFWPWAREAFSRPLASGIDAHFRAEIRQPAGMIE